MKLVSRALRDRLKDLTTRGRNTQAYCENGVGVVWELLDIEIEEVKVEGERA